MIYTTADNGTIKLGFVNDNKATVIQFPVANIFSLFGNTGSFILLHRRPQDEAAYPVPNGQIAVDGDFLKWTLNSYDVQYSGNGECQLCYTVGDVVKMTQKWRTAVSASLVNSEIVPDPYETWLDDLTEQADRAEAAAERAEAAESKTPHIGANGNWYVWNAVTEQWVDSGTSARPSFVVVGALPAEGQSGIIYLVPSAYPGAKNIYDEYIWVGTDYDPIGTTAIDLSGYVPKTWLNGTDTVALRILGTVQIEGDNFYVYTATGSNTFAASTEEIGDTTFLSVGIDNQNSRSQFKAEAFNDYESPSGFDLHPGGFDLYGNISINGETALAKTLPTTDGQYMLLSTVASGVGALSWNGIDRYLNAMLIHDTASDTLAAFPDGAIGFNADDVTVDIPNGSPTVTEITLWANGVNCYDEVTELGGIDASGNNTVNNNRIRSKNYIPIKPSTSYFYKSSTNDQLFFYAADDSFVSSTYKNNTSFTTPATARFMRIFYHNSYGTAYQNDGGINYPSTETAYHAYNGTKYAVNLPVSVNEGSLDLTTGALTVVSPTPGTYSLTPTVVPVKQGQNNIIADVGTTTVQYVANTKLYIDKQ